MRSTVYGVEHAVAGIQTMNIGSERNGDHSEDNDRTVRDGNGAEDNPPSTGNQSTKKGRKRRNRRRRPYPLMVSMHPWHLHYKFLSVPT